MLTIILGVGLLLSSVSSLPYLRDVMKGRARPRLVSWAVWALLLTTMTYIAVSEGQVASAVLSMVSAIGCTAIVVVGWRRGSRGLTRFDTATLIGAIIGMGLLFLKPGPVVSLVILLAVDTIAYAPTLLHAWREPEEESLTSWAYSASGSVLIFLAALISQANAAGMLYPAYSATFGVIMLVILITGRVRETTGSYQSETVD